WLGRRRIAARELHPYALERSQPECPCFGFQSPCPPAGSDLQVTILQSGATETVNGDRQRAAFVAGQATTHQAIELVVVDALAHRQQGPVELGRLQSDGLGKIGRRRGAAVAPGVYLDLLEVVGRRRHASPYAATSRTDQLRRTVALEPRG